MAKKKQKSKKLYKYLLIVCIPIIIAILILLIINLGLFKEPKILNLQIKDECSLILGNILHPIKDSEGCKLKCIAACETHSLGYKESRFTQKENSCHECACSCI